MMVLTMLIFSLLSYKFINKVILNNFFENMICIMLVMFTLFYSRYNNMMSFYWFMFIDYYNSNLILLTFIVMLLSLMSMLKVNFKSLYVFNLLILLVFLTLTFLSNNYMLFYLFFEVTMIPTFFLILGWGSQFERIEASVYMVIYTFFGSLPMITVLLKIYWNSHTMSMILLMNSSFITSLYMFLFILLGFILKLPLFMMHLWLPKAHVEAPVSGSMILAGIMLKLGGYGIIRVLSMMKNYSTNMSILLISMGVVGSFFISILCIQQVDMKMLIAYSSVMHMSSLLAMILTNSYWAIKGSLILMLGHGLCSSGLFYLVGLVYKRMKSRSLFLNKGMMNMSINLTLFWFFFCVFNMASPPSINLFSEICMINSILMWSSSIIILIIFSSFFSIVYMMFFYAKMQHGDMFKSINNFFVINIQEYLVLKIHLIPMLLIILKL